MVNHVNMWLIFLCRHEAVKNFRCSEKNFRSPHNLDLRRTFFSQDCELFFFLTLKMMIGSSRNLNFKRPWHDLYQERRARLRQNLHILQPTHGAILELCHTKLLATTLIDISDYRCDSQ